MWTAKGWLACYYSAQNDGTVKDIAEKLEIAFFGIDEVHCICEWGVIFYVAELAGR
jgi:hypothetical protein